VSAVVYNESVRCVVVKLCCFRFETTNWCSSTVVLIMCGLVLGIASLFTLV